MGIFGVEVLRLKRIVIDLVFPKINVTKLQTVITFDRIWPESNIEKFIKNR